MKPETAIVDIHRKYKVYTERYCNPAARKTIILVNGAFATTASFAQTVRYLQPRFNVVLYDQPYAGQSKPYNYPGRLLSEEDEAEILLELIERVAADHVLSFSWGGAATLLALAQRPRRIEKAVIASFAGRISQPMRDYLESGLNVLQTCDRIKVGRLINSTIGKHLPPLFKRFNFRYISSLAEHEYRQMHAHFNEVLKQGAQRYIACAAAIDIPLLFVNGEWDEYTSTGDARLFAGHARQCQFRTIRNTGHFLDMEHKEAWRATRQALLGFLQQDSGVIKAPVVRPLERPHRYVTSDHLLTARRAVH
ncbi:alpha/beta hydrolase [Pseudomonas sp. LFM046]|uniref:alpha/beta fold hydrolase n=1 Tax=Pseudomonas sp. LFM046 TaxID=1608357 RepID=UPI0005CFC484|nr:alpha/beta hydrolase [Pseudomonas sp. LFM046]